MKILIFINMHNFLIYLSLSHIIVKISNFFSDSTGQDTTIEISVPIPPHSNLSNCSGDCDFAQVSIHTCVTIKGPPSAFPSSIMWDDHHQYLGYGDNGNNNNIIFVM